MDVVVMTDVTCLDELLGMVQLSLPLVLTLLMLLHVLLLQLLTVLRSSWVCL